MKKAKKLISLLMTAVLCVGLFSGAALADGETEAEETSTLSILALGDSITAGYGLTDLDSQCFTALLAAATGATVINEGVSGQKSGELLTAIAAGTYTAEIAQADVVTITIGGNDLMAAFYQIVADTYNSSIAALIAMGYMTAITADDVQAALADPTSTLGKTLIQALMTTDLSTALSDSAVFTKAVTDCITNIVSVTAAIKAVNPDAVVIVANQYNPYQWLGVENVNSLFATAVTAYNTALAQYAAVGGYLVADVYTAFSAYTTTLTNADLATYNFDFHPNAAGHAVIAEVMASTYTAYLAEEAQAQAEAEAEALVAAAITQISAAVTAAQALNESDYTAESWAVLQAALASAQAILTDLQTNGVNTSLTTTEITAAYLALTSAVSALVKEEESTSGTEDPEALVAAAITQISTAVTEAQALDESDYTAESWAVLQAALASVQAVLTDLQTNGVNTSLTTEEITAACLALTSAVSALVEEEDTQTTTADDGDEGSTSEEEDDSSSTTAAEEDTSDANEEEGNSTEEEEQTASVASSTDGTTAAAASTGSSAPGTGDVSVWIYFVLLIGAASGTVLFARKKEA